MSNFNIDVNGFKTPRGDKLIRFAVTLPDGDVLFAVLLSPDNAIAAGKMLQQAGEAGKRLIDLPSEAPQGFKVTH